MMEKYFGHFGASVFGLSVTVLFLLVGQHDWLGRVIAVALIVALIIDCRAHRLAWEDAPNDLVSPRTAAAGDRLHKINTFRSADSDPIAVPADLGSRDQTADNSAPAADVYDPFEGLI